MILNLVNPTDSEVKFKVSRFPDQQQNITITDEIVNKYVLIKSRLNSWLDLELIVCAVASLRNMNVKSIELFVPYFCGARSDRKFERGGNNYLKDVICPVINSLNFDSVTVLDPHSYCLEMGLKNFKKISNAALVEWSVRDILVNNTESHIKDLIYIAPDAGATHKIYSTLKEAKIEDNNIITCSKERDNEGKLTKCVVPIPIQSKNSEWLDYRKKDFIIIDDICDGGRTFINIAKELKVQLSPEANIYLIVTHGIFSAGYEELYKYFDGIYTTNSVKEVPSLLKLWGDKTEFTKQLNIF